MIFILDRSGKVIGFLKNGGGVEEAPPFFEDILTQDLGTGAETFQFTTIDKNLVSQYLIVGNYVAFKDEQGKFKLFQIVQTETTHEEVIYITVYAECAGLELLNKVFRKRKMTACTLNKFIEAITSETGWEKGSLFLSEKSLDLEIEDGSVYEVLQNNISKFGGEIEFRVEIRNGQIVGKYIDIPYQRGRVTGKRFTFGRDIESIVRKIDSTDLFTALIGVGKDGISFRDVTVEGINKPLGQDYVIDEEAYNLYNNRGYHLMGLFQYETTSPEELLLQTYKHLQTVKMPKIEYEVEVALLDRILGTENDKTQLGDTVAIVDNAFNPPIHLMARITKLETSKTDTQANKCTLANFIEVRSNITDEMRRLASELEGYVDSSIGSRFPINGNDIQDGSVGGNHIIRDSITTGHLKAELVEAVTGKFENLEAKDAKIENLVTTNLEAVNGKIDNLESTTANIGILTADVANIKNIVSGNISSDNIQSGGITGDRLNMSTIFVKDANIIDLSASKINTGEINTSKVLITSEDGGIRMVGSTQQFMDEKGNVRIQLGKDAQGRFDFFILDDLGNILFNPSGITGNAIENGLIKEDMLSDGSIGGKKIKWDSFMTEFNSDTNTHKLKTSKVVLDGTNQTMDVHFNQMSSRVDGVESTTESNATQIGVAQGKIEALIQDTTIVKDGETVKLKDEYNKTVATVDGMKNTIGAHSTTINEHTGKIEKAEVTTNELIKTVDSLKSRIGNAETSIGEIDTEVDGLGVEVIGTKERVSAIEQEIDSITLGVSSLDKEIYNIYTEKPADYIGRYLLGTPQVVSDPTLAIYEASGIPNPPIGAVFGSFRQSTNLIKKDTISSNGTSWAIIAGYELYKNTKDEYKKEEAKQIIANVANFLASNISVGRFNSGDFKFVDTGYKFNSTSGEWERSQYKELYITTMWLQVQAFTCAFEILGLEIYKELATDILGSLVNAHFYINDKVDSKELPSHLRWASYEYLVCDNLSSSYRFNGSSRMYANQMGYYMFNAITTYTKAFGNIELTTPKGQVYKPKDVLDGYRNYLLNLYKNHGLTAEPSGLPYGYVHRNTETDGSYTYKCENWNFIDDVWGDEWFVGDVVTYIIFGFACLGLTDIARKYVDKYYEYRVPVETPEWKNRFGINDLVFFDRLDFHSCTHLPDDSSISITYTALFYDIVKSIGITEYADRCCYTLAKWQLNSVDDKFRDGAYPWDISKDGASLEFKSFGEIINSAFYKNLNVASLQNIDSKFAEIEITTEGITQRVESTEGGISEIEKKYAELKITDEQISQSVANNYGEFTQFKQSSTNFQWKVENQIGGQNLIKNSGFLCGSDHYHLAPYEWGGTNNSVEVWNDSNPWVLNGTKALCIQGSYSNGGAYGVRQDQIKLKPNTEYTLSGYASTHRGKWRISLAQDDWAWIASARGVSEGGKDPNKWDRFSITFTTGSASDYLENCKLDLMLEEAGREAHVWFTSLVLTEGSIAQKWQPHPHELYVSNMKFDTNGLTCEFEDGTYSKMGRDGFKYYNGSTGFTHHAICYATSFGIPAGNPGEVEVALPIEFTKRQSSLRWTVALRGYYYETSGDFFPMHVHCSGINHYVHSDGRIRCRVEGYCKIQNADNYIDKQNRPLTAMLIAIC